MKNIFHKLEFHYSFLLMAFGLAITGHFSNLIIFTSLIIIHELGHTITAILFRYKVKKIIIYPYGGLTKLNAKINTDIYKDLLISVSGIVMQSIYFFLIYLLYITGFVREYIYNLFFLYHTSMLIFNLLPIVPLDGFQILNLILSKYIHFTIANNLSVIISLISIIFFLFSDLYEKNYSIMLTISILMHSIYKFYNQITYIYNKFLLERYLYNFKYESTKIIKNINKMYKNKNHLFIKENKIITEKAFLSDFFKKK